jgi:hypothetical protein
VELLRELFLVRASLANYSKIQLLSFFYKLLDVHCPASVLFVIAISFCFVHACEKLGSPCSSLSSDGSVLCCTCVPGV